MASTAPPKKIQVKIFSPYQTYYAGEAVSVTGVNKTGPFDVLVDHANFFSLLSAGNLVVNTGFQQLRFKLNSGIIKVNDNSLTVFVNI